MRFPPPYNEIFIFTYVTKYKFNIKIHFCGKWYYMHYARNHEPPYNIKDI